MCPRLSFDDDVDPIDAAVNDAINSAADDNYTDSSVGDDYSGDANAGAGEQNNAQGQTQQPTNTQDNTRQQQPPGTDQRNRQQPASNAQGQPRDQGTQAPGSAGGQQTGVNQQQQPERQFGQQVRDDGRGNFVDAQGKVVARAGAERRLYESARRMENDMINARNEAGQYKGRITQLEQGLQRATTEVQRMQTQMQSGQGQSQEPDYITQAKRGGLTDDHIRLGVGIVAQMQQDPVAGVRQVLQTALAKGYNIQQLIGNVEGVPNSSLDMGAVRTMIDNAMQPLVQEHQQRQQMTEREQRSQQAYNTFVSTHEHADKHMEAIARLVQNNPQLTPEAAYYQVRMFAVQNGLDFSQPLGPQYERAAQARQGGNGNNAGQQQQQQPNFQPPMLDGTGVNSNMNTQTHHDNFNGDSDIDSIISSAMRESGMMQQ